jgi:predicted nucleic acid-binding Zn ribbon protein
VKPPEKPRKPRPIGEAVASFLDNAGLAKRVAQASVVPEWPELVGEQIASLTEPISVSRDGTLFVSVLSSAWMNELSLMEPQLLEALNRKAGRPPVRRIHWRLTR